MAGGAGGGVGGAEDDDAVSTSTVDPNNVNAVLYALSTIAQTCAALAALVGALALYKLQGMSEAHRGNERAIRAIRTSLVGASAVSANSPFNAPLDQVLRTAKEQIANPSTFQPQLVEGLRAAMTEWGVFDVRYAHALTWFVIFEAWNLAAILAALVGFAGVTWLAAHWSVFVCSLIVGSAATVAVTGGALFVMARRDSTKGFALSSQKEGS